MTKRPVRVIQFGGGVFLRGFFNWMMQKAIDAGKYDGSAVIVRSRTRGKDPLEDCGYRYLHLARDGAHSDETFVDCIAGSVSASENYEGFLQLADVASVDVIVSNTTEAGIVYEACERPADQCPQSFPAKLTALLYRRYLGTGKGFLILPCELIENNGDRLREIVLRHAADWTLGTSFEAWIKHECSFRNTLVDRIVSGKPENNGFHPELSVEQINMSEYYHLFCIEGEEDPRLPFASCGLHTLWVPSVDAYRTIKVRLLNGAHTSMIPYAMLCGLESVGDCLADPNVKAHLCGCLDEIVESLDVDRKEAQEYASDVLTRFQNPYVHHLCASISLNSISKFRVRVLPSILSYLEKQGKPPKRLLFAFAKLIEFYQMGTPNDDPALISYIKQATLEAILSNQTLWGQDLTFLTKEIRLYANSSKG